LHRGLKSSGGKRSPPESDSISAIKREVAWSCPIAEQRLGLVVAADQRCDPRAQCFKAADDPALADRAPDSLPLAETGERLGAEILDVEPPICRRVLSATTGPG
jgi:hypothetical protein